MSNYSNNTCIVGKLFLNNETIKNEPNTSAATATSNELNSIILDQAAALLRAGEVVAFPTEVKPQSIVIRSFILFHTEDTFPLFRRFMGWALTL